MKSCIAVLCYKLLQYYLSRGGQEQLELLKQQTSTFLSKEIAKSSTHQAVYNEIHSDNNRRKIVLGSNDVIANKMVQKSFSLIGVCVGCVSTLH